MWKTTLVFKVTLVYQIFTVFVKLDWNIMKLGPNIKKLHMKFYGLFYVKNKVSGKNLNYFFILLWHRFTWNWRQNVAIFLIFWHKKIKLANGFIHETDMKLWNRQIRSGKKIETDGTRFLGFFAGGASRRRQKTPKTACRQFQFFSWPKLVVS